MIINIFTNTDDNRNTFTYYSYTNNGTKYLSQIGYSLFHDSYGSKFRSFIDATSGFIYESDFLTYRKNGNFVLVFGFNCDHLAQDQIVKFRFTKTNFFLWKNQHIS
jgi:hypothetical protein